MNVAQLKPDVLGNFYGTMAYHRIVPFKQVVTDGVKHVMDNADCYWLVTDIFAEQLNSEVAGQPFQVWTIEVKNGNGTLVCEDGNGNELQRSTISYTDFPLDKFTFWLVDGVLMLPSEY